MSIARRLWILVSVPLLILVALGVFSRIQIARVEEDSRFVTETRIAALGTLAPYTASPDETGMTHLGPAITFVREHHERLDGSGYPDRKKGSDISVGGQVLGLAEL
jgi:hypothetical protein